MGCPTDYTLFTKFLGPYVQSTPSGLCLPTKARIHLFVLRLRIKPTRSDSKMCPCAEVTACLLTCLTDKILMQQDHLHVLCLLLC